MTEKEESTPPPPSLHQFLPLELLEVQRWLGGWVGGVGVGGTAVSVSPD